MTASTRSTSAPHSNDSRWQRWMPSALPTFARVDTIRWPARDSGGASLRPIPELTEITSGLHAYHGLQGAGGLDAASRAAVLARIGDLVGAAVDRLRERGLDLFWRIEGGNGAAAAHRNLHAALAIARRRD